MYVLISVLFFTTRVCADQHTPTDAYLLDTIEAVVLGQEGTEIITKSDIDRPSLGGGIRTRDDIIFERLVYLDAQKHKIFSDEDAVDAYLSAIQREHNMTRDELVGIFTAAGYTFEEGRQQLQMMQSVNSMLDFKIRSNLIVPRKDVEAYYQEHPEFIEASYDLQRAFVPFSTVQSKEEQRATLEQFAKTGRGVGGIEWSQPFTINHSDIAEDKQFIYTMRPREISMPQEISGGFELFRLNEKHEQRLRGFDERYREITDILRRPKYDELLAEYRKKLWVDASVIYFDLTP